MPSVPLYEEEKCHRKKVREGKIMQNNQDSMYFIKTACKGSTVYRVWQAQKQLREYDAVKQIIYSILYPARGRKKEKAL